MSLKYVYQSDRSELQRDPLAAGEVIKEGEFVTRTDSGELTQFDPANDSLPHGIVVHNPRGDSINKHDEDYVAYEDLWTYRGDEGDRAYFMPLTAGDQIMPQTVTDQQDANGNVPPEPTIGDGTTVGIIVGPSGETRVVEEGYTYDANDDGTAETFSESGSGDFVALGRVYQEPQHKILENNYDQRIPVQLDADIFQP